MKAYEEMYKWADEELKTGSRIKASRIFRVAQAMEERHNLHQAKLLEEKMRCLH